MLAQPHSELKPNPVNVLSVYIVCTRELRQGPCHPLFSALNTPRGGLQTETIARVMEQGIEQTGLAIGGKSYTAKQ